MAVTAWTKCAGPIAHPTFQPVQENLMAKCERQKERKERPTTTRHVRKACETHKTHTHNPYPYILEDATTNTHTTTTTTTTTIHRYERTIIYVRFARGTQGQGPMKHARDGSHGNVGSCVGIKDNVFVHFIRNDHNMLIFGLLQNIRHALQFGPRKHLTSRIL